MTIEPNASPRVLDEAHGNGWALYNADAIDLMRQMPDRSVDCAVYSPPYANLYTYSDSMLDMGNCVDMAEFIKHYEYAIRELYRVMRPGRVVCVDCKDLVVYKGSSEDSMAGLVDFPGELIRIHKAVGFSWHSRVTIWRSPVTEMQKTKAHGLLYKQLRKDSTFSRMGMPVYVLMFRKWAPDEEEGKDVVPVSHSQDEFPLDTWQRWASPVWTDVDFTNVLNVTKAREDRDEKHMCPMPLDITERCLALYSNPGEVVFSPFAGIGSEGHQALRMGRKFVGCELKRSYFDTARANLAAVEPNGRGQTLDLMSLFGRNGSAK